MGYCGGEAADPTYKLVCSDPQYDDYAEAIQVEFDPTVLSYEQVLEAFFRMHDATRGGRSRQYSSIIFAHDASQHAAAERALAANPRSTTLLEAAQPYWIAEPYHQKWILQRKRELFLSLGMCDVAELLGPSATVLNAVASGKLPGRIALDRLEKLMMQGELTAAAHGAVAALIDPF